MRGKEADGVMRPQDRNRRWSGPLAWRRAARASCRFEMAAVDVFTEGLLMAPASAIPRLLARDNLTFSDIALWEIHEAFSAQVLCHIKALDDKDLAPFL